MELTPETARCLQDLERCSPQPQSPFLEHSSRILQSWTLFRCTVALPWATTQQRHLIWNVIKKLKVSFTSLRWGTQTVTLSRRDMLSGTSYNNEGQEKQALVCDHIQSSIVSQRFTPETQTRPRVYSIHTNISTSREMPECSSGILPSVHVLGQGQTRKHTPKIHHLQCGLDATIENEVWSYNNTESSREIQEIRKR